MRNLMVSSFKTTGFVLLCLVCVVVLNSMVWFSWNPSFILNDGVQYLSTAKNWLEGRGFSTNALMFTPHFQGVLPAPQTVWPPGYPLIVAITTTLGITLHSAALLVNLISLAANSLLVFMMLVRYKISFRVAVCCALAFYLTAMPWSYSLALATEPLFSALILAAIIFQPNDPKGKIWPWVVSGTFIALCISVRYSGVLFSAGVGLGVFTYLIKNYRKKPDFLWRGIALLTLQISISFALFITLTYRTYLLTGTTSREVGVIDTGDLLARIKLMIWQVREFIGFTDGGVLPNVANNILFASFVFILAAILAQTLFVLVKRSKQDSPKNIGSNKIIHYIILGHTVVFVAFFSLNFVGIILVDLNHRYLYQIYPGLFVLFCIAVADSFKKIKQLNLVGLNKLFCSSIIGLVFLFALAQVNFATALKFYSNPGVQSRETLALQVSDGVDLKDLIQSCFAGSGTMAGSIWSNDGQQLHHATGVPTITIADVYGNKPYDMNIVSEHIASYDIKMFVILNDLPDIAPQYVEMLSNVKAWLVQNGYKKLPMLENEILNNITVDAYVIDQSCLTID